VTAYDEKHLQSQDSDEKVDNSNKTLIEKVNNLQDRKLLGLFRKKTKTQFLQNLFFSSS
jgi:hypothetical protein